MTSSHATESTGAERVPTAVDQAHHEPAGEPVGHAGTRVVVSERECWRISGWVAVAGILALIGVCGMLVKWMLGESVEDFPPLIVPAFIVIVLVAILLASTLVVVQPGTTRVVQFFGRYLGTIRRTGLSMTVPLSTKTQVSVRVNNFETARLKVNDADGNPVDVAAIVVWQVADTAKAHYAVENYRAFNQVQAEAALRHVAGEHPYDDTSGSGTSLRGSTDVVAQELAREVAARVLVAGLEIVEVRISHLAYAQEIAQAMLQRQQASAVVAARERIVEGAVGMVEMALGRLSEREIVELDDERRAAMVSNLLVVLCGESRATPVVNTGSLYN